MVLAQKKEENKEEEASMCFENGKLVHDFKKTKEHKGNNNDDDSKWHQITS